MFQFAVVFMDTAATIPTGAMAFERWRFASFLVYGLLIPMLLYLLYGNWAIWGGGAGWLRCKLIRGLGLRSQPISPGRRWCA